METQDAKCPHCEHELVATQNGWGDVKCTNCGRKFSFQDNTIESGSVDDNIDNDQKSEKGFRPSQGFSTLLSFGKTISALGWICAAISIIAGLVTAIMAENIIPFLYGMGGAISGAVIVAYGQLISCFVSMERGIQDIKQEAMKLNQGKP